MEVRTDAKFLTEFSAGSIGGMFAWVDMAACRKPALGSPMIDQQDLTRIGIYEHAIGNQMFGWLRWLGDAEDLRAAIDPVQHVSPVVGLLRIERRNVADDRSHDFSHTTTLADAK